VFSLPWRPGVGGFDDADLQEFLEDHSVVELTQHFFVHEKTPHLVLVLGYRAADPARQSPRPGGTSGRNTAAEAAALLDPAEQRIFEALRVWRNQYARRTGRPPYVVFTNRQAAEIARRDPASRAQLQEVEGLGESRIDDFGAELLACLEGLRQADGQVSGQGATDV